MVILLDIFEKLPCFLWHIIVSGFWYFFSGAGLESRPQVKMSMGTQYPKPDG
jgi:hypothetical protein